MSALSIQPLPMALPMDLVGQVAHYLPTNTRLALMRAAKRFATPEAFATIFSDKLFELAERFFAKKPSCYNRGLHEAKKLHLIGKVITKEQLARLVRCFPKLQELVLDRSQVTDEMVASLAPLVTLRKLSLIGNAEVKGLTLVELSTTLQELILDQCSVDDAALKGLEGHKSIITLSLFNNRKVSADTLTCLQGSNLSRLCLAHCSVSDKTFPALNALQQLESLDLTGNKGVKDPDLSELSSRLSRLSLARCPLSSEARRAASGLTRIRIVLI